MEVSTIKPANLGYMCNKPVNCRVPKMDFVIRSAFCARPPFV